MRPRCWRQLTREEIEGEFMPDLALGDGTHGFWFDWVFAKVLLREAPANGKAERGGEDVTVRSEIPRCWKRTEVR